MKIYWTSMTEMTKPEPEIFCFDLRKDGMFIGVPGTLIFRKREEAQAAIAAAKAAVEANKNI